VSHPTLNHKPLPTSKNILTPMRASGFVPWPNSEVDRASQHTGQLLSQVACPRQFCEYLFDY
jgi:hypothetical protein